jgi:hypothetical protein
MAEKDPIATLDKLAHLLDKRVGDILWDNLTRVRDKLRAEEPLHKRTRGMPYVRRPIQLQGNLIEAGLYAPPAWAAAHIGVGQTTITPHGHGFLAIPTDFVKLVAGHPVGPKQYSGLKIFGGIMWGVAGWGGAGTGGGIRQRRAAGEKMGKQTLIPLFILKGSVVIKKRIDPGQLIAWIKPQFFADLKKSCLLDQL